MNSTISSARELPTVPWNWNSSTGEGLVSLRQESVRETLVHEGRKTFRAIDFSEGELPLETVLNNDWLDGSLRGYLFGRNEESTVEARMVRSRCFLDLEVRISEDDFGFFLSRLPLASNLAR